jgi:hypothetical protein
MYEVKSWWCHCPGGGGGSGLLSTPASDYDAVCRERDEARQQRDNASGLLYEYNLARDRLAAELEQLKRDCPQAIYWREQVERAEKLAAENAKLRAKVERVKMIPRQLVVAYKDVVHALADELEPRKTDFACRCCKADYFPEEDAHHGYGKCVERRTGPSSRRSWTSETSCDRRSGVNRRNDKRG